LLIVRAVDRQELALAFSNYSILNVATCLQ